MAWWSSGEAVAPNENLPLEQAGGYSPAFGFVCIVTIRGPFCGLISPSACEVAFSETGFFANAQASAGIQYTAMGDVKLVVLNSYGSRAEALLAKGALEAAGIPAMTQADTVGGMREHIAWSGAGFQILVRDEDVAAARELLTQTVEDNSDEAGGESRSPWRRFT